MENGIDVVLEDDELEVDAQADFLKGDPGYTPKKGIDYYTEAEKQEIIQTVTHNVNKDIVPQEQQRENNEQKRLVNENTRVESEKQRNSQEMERETNELKRISSEDTRKSNETTRSNNETNRIQNENTRITKESERQNQEKQRQNSFAQMGQAVDNAIKNIVDLQEAYNTNATNKTTEFNENVTAQTNTFNKNAEDKTSDFNRNAQKKLDEYNENLEVLENRIIELEDQVFDLETENENIKNQFPTGQAEGENITLNDSSDMEFKELRIGGNSWQETRSGINKFDISKAKRTSGVCSLQNNGNSIDVIATNTSQYISANIDITDLFKEGETIYAMADFVASGSNTGAYRIQWAEDTGSTKGNLILMSHTSGSVKSGTIPTKPEGATKLFLYLYGNVEGTVTSGDTVTYSKIMLSNQPITEYEQYGAMPSPEFRSEIRNVGDNGSANITVCNKNLLKTLKWINGTYIHAKLPKLNTSYFLSLRLKDGKTIPSDLYFGFSRDGDYNSAGFTKWLIDKGEFSSYNSIDRNNFKYTSNIRYDGTVLGYIAVFPATYAGNLGEYFDIQLEEKINYDHATDYVESESQQFTFPLAEGQRMYKDSYLADDGVHHNEDLDEFIGADNEEWRALENLNNDETTWFQSYKPSNVMIAILTNGQLKCSHFKNYNCYANTNTKEGVCIHKEGGFQIRIKNSYLKDTSTLSAKLASFKEYLAEQKANGTPLFIQYPLENEVIEPYTEAQQLVYNEIKKAHSYKNVTHIFSTDEIKTVLDVTYRKDLETMINNINNAILGGN